MIYEFPTLSEPIKQGDIFLNIPRVEFNLSEDLAVLEGDEKISNITWEELVFEKKDIAAILGISLVPAIVAAQTCDAQRKEYITLCEVFGITNIKRFENLQNKTLRNVTKELIKHNRDIPDIFYLPPDDNIGFSDRMIVNFSSTIRLYRTDLEKLISNRKGKLNSIANEHFREKLSHYFHRYAWNEWYILNKQELIEHGGFSDLKTNELYDYQK